MACLLVTAAFGTAAPGTHTRHPLRDAIETERVSGVLMSALTVHLVSTQSNPYVHGTQTGLLGQAEMAHGVDLRCPGL